MDDCEIVKEIVKGIVMIALIIFGIFGLKHM